MWSGFWFHTSMQSSKYRCIPYNLGLKIVNNKTIWYVTTLFSSHLFTGKLTKTSSCLPTKWRRRHRACILLSGWPYHVVSDVILVTPSSRFGGKQPSLDFLEVWSLSYFPLDFDDIWRSRRSNYINTYIPSTVCHQNSSFFPKTWKLCTIGMFADSA